MIQTQVNLIVKNSQPKNDSKNVDRENEDESISPGIYKSKEASETNRYQETILCCNQIKSSR